MRFKGETIPFLRFRIELFDCVFQTTCPKSDHRSRSDEKLLLHDATWLEKTWHQTKVAARVNQDTV